MKRRDFISLSGAGAVGAASSGKSWHRLAAADDAADAQEDPRLAEISRLIETKMAELRVPGVAFGLVKKGALALRGFGVTNLDNPQPVTADTVFPIMSISKTVAAVALLKLVDEGRAALDAPVREYLRAFKVRDEEASRALTLRHLLTHTAGWEGQLPTAERGDRTLSMFIDELADVPQLAPTGRVWSYHNAGFGVASRVVEVVTGRGVHDAFRELVFSPLSLDRAFTRTGDALTYRFAAPHVERGGRVVVSRPFDLPANTGAGGGAMSLESIMAYARFHLSGGVNEKGEPVLSRASVELMRTPQLLKQPTSDEMGVGWHLRRLGGVLTAAQCGTGGGHCLHLQVVPERDLGFAILTNHTNGWRLNSAVETAVLKLYEGLARTPGQATGGNRGGNEDMTAHAAPLSSTPSLAEYVGKYDRTPTPGYDLTLRDGRLIAGTSAGERPLAFWGRDLAYQDSRDANHGIPVEFIRDEAGAVRWLRFNGRIARKA
jgi:CubicO group peptidase (beta-lactamase class C family)